MKLVVLIISDKLQNTTSPKVGGVTGAEHFPSTGEVTTFSPLQLFNWN